MHIQLTLEAPERVSMPSNHSDLLLSTVYDVLRTSNPDFADYLHEGGVDIDGDEETDKPYRKKYKLYTYSGLRGSYEFSNNIMAFDGGKIWWRLASPVMDFIKYFTEGVKQKGYIKIGSYKLPVSGIENFKEPNFTKGKNKFVCLSPIVIPNHKSSDENTVYFCRCCRRESKNLPKQCPFCLNTELIKKSRYILPGDDNYIPALKANLYSKYKAVHKEEVQNKDITIEFDKGYVDRKNIVKSTYFRTTQYLGVMCPLYLSGNPSLINIAYQCGLGEKNSTGYGMISPINNK